MKRILALCALCCFCLALTGCGPDIAPPATEAEKKAAETGVNDMAKMMEGKMGENMSGSEDVGGLDAGGAGGSTESGGGDAPSE